MSALTRHSVNVDIETLANFLHARLWHILRQAAAVHCLPVWLP